MATDRVEPAVNPSCRPAVPPCRPCQGLCVALLFAALLALGAPPLLSRAGASLLVVTFLDVGQGDAAWIRTPAGDDILVDGGPQAAGARVVDYLQTHGCTDIETMLLSHPHADHVEGLTVVLDYLPTARVWFNGQPCSTTAYCQFLDRVVATGVSTTVLSAGQVYTSGLTQLTVLHPETLGADDNNNSVVFRLSYGTVDLLFTGDVEIPAEGHILDRGDPLEAEVLKVAHHGSRYSSTADWLQAVSPREAIISVGAGNPYGHPAPETLARLAAVRATVYRTDLNGAITVMTDGRSYTVRAERYLLFLPLAYR